MKFWSVVGAFTLIVLLSLLLSVVLTILITRSDSPSIVDIIAIAREEGWLHGPGRASDIWEEYQARIHAPTPLKANALYVFLIVFCCVFTLCWGVVKSRKQIGIYLWRSRSFVSR